MHRLPLLAALLLLAAACASDDEGTAPVTSAGPAAVITATTTAAPTTSTTAAPTTTTTTAAPDTSPNDVWVAVLASLPTANAARGDAEAKAKELGVGTSNVLASDDYGSLEPGYWVVTADTFDDRRSAGNACFEYRDTAPDCYPRYLGPDPTAPFGAGSGQILAVVDDALVVLATETGARLRTIERHWSGDGVFADVPRAVPGATTGYFGAGFEDSWYSCESSRGLLSAVNLETGIVTEVADGVAPAVSPAGSSLAYLRAATCIPDPEIDGFWAVFFDTVVVRDLATGEERAFTVDEPEQMSIESNLRTIAWSPDGAAIFVLDGLSQVHRLDIAAGGSPIGTLVVPSLGENIQLVGVTAEGLLLYAEHDYTARTSSMYRIDPATGETALVTAYPDVARFSLDPTGTSLAVQFGEVLSVDGATVAIDEPASDISW